VTASIHLSAWLDRRRASESDTTGRSLMHTCGHHHSSCCCPHKHRRRLDVSGHRTPSASHGIQEMEEGLRFRFSAGHKAQVSFGRKSLANICNFPRTALTTRRRQP
jgi:hypothetical protein